MFKDYLEKKLEDKGKQIEQKSKIDKEVNVVQLNYKGNQKQFELNTELDVIIENIETEYNRSEPNLAFIKSTPKKQGSLSQRGVYLGVKTCEVFLCFVAIVRVRVYYVDFFVFFVLRHW